MTRLFRFHNLIEQLTELQNSLLAITSVLPMMQLRSSQLEGVHWTKYKMEGGKGWHRALWAYHPPNTLMCSPIRKLSEVYHLGVFNGGSIHGHD